MGFSLSDVYNTISMEFAPYFINQMTYGGRIKRVFIQNDARHRIAPDALRHLYSPVGPGAPAAGVALDPPGGVAPINPSAANPSISPYNMLPLSSVIRAKWGSSARPCSSVTTAIRRSRSSAR